MSIFLGGTGSANELEDYEEGSFTPRLGGSGNPGSYYVEGTGTYVKIGKKVTVATRFNNVDLNNSSSGTVIVFNMPFTGGHRPNDGASGVTSDFVVYNVGFNTNYFLSFYLAHSNTIWYGLLSRTNNSWDDWYASDWHSSGVYMMFHGTYFTDS